MDWVIGILLLVVGGIIGFFIAKQLLENKLSNQKSQTSEQTIKEIMAQQAATHLYQSRQVAETLQQQCDALRTQLDAYEDLLNSEVSSEDKNQLSYFGDQATAFIRNQQNQQKTQRASSEIQPQDFSNESSGLFSGSKNQQLVDENK